MRTSFLRMVAVILIPVMVLCSVSAACAGQDLLKPTWGLDPDTSSDGAVISLGLFVAVVAVLLVIGLHSDIDNVFGQHSPSPAVPAVSNDSLARRASLVLDTPMVMNRGTGTVAEQMASAAPSDSVGVGLRITF